MTIAKKIIDQPEQWVGDTHIYELDVAFGGYGCVAVSVHGADHGQWQNGGTEIVGCTERGNIPGSVVRALFQSYVIMSHSDALAAIGITVEEVL